MSSASTWSRRAVLGGLAAAGATAATPRGRGEPNAERRESPQEADGPLADTGAFESFLDGVMESQLEAHSIAGATVSVVDGDETFAKGYGYADVENREAVRADETLFRVGSVSKLFAWTAAMQAVERGDLAVDTDVNQYLDAVEIPDTYPEPITLGHLATHTPGFEDRFRGTFVPGRDDVRPLETVLREEQPARVRPPGEHAAYSNYGTAIAGHLAAETAGEPFETHVRESIFDPLGMDRSTFAQPVPEGLRDDLSKGYAPAGGGFESREFEYVGIPPTGAMSATATDMATFVRAHLGDGATSDGRILEPASTSAMHRQRFTHDDRLNGMCFGFYEVSRNGVRAVGHGGDTALFHSLLFLLPERDVGAFVSYNSPGGLTARREFLDAFFDQFYPADGTAPTEPVDETPPTESADETTTTESAAETTSMRSDGRPTRAADVTGTYRSLRMPYTTSEKIVGATDTVDVSVDDEGRLVTSPLGGETTRWVERDPLYFEEVGGPDAIAFGETDGEISHLFFDSRPPTAYGRIPPRERTLAHVAALAVSILVFLTALFGWPAAAVWRQIRGRAGPVTAHPRGSRAARLVAGLAAGGFTAFLAVFLTLLVSNPLALFGGDPLLPRALLAVAAVGALATLATAAFTTLAWRDGYWSRWHRVHYSLVALAAAVTTLVLAYWNLLWYQA
ncbi:serine hydrolase domain-containing protein [Halosimplex sp. TS25]|uniref:serine hydrolase domain-containing protein n=1 Tax=Halosimplex rarum TaxID=3396619 RepID=UPI0039EA1C10